MKSRNRLKSHVITHTTVLVNFYFQWFMRASGPPWFCASKSLRGLRGGLSNASARGKIRQGTQNEPRLWITVWNAVRVERSQLEDRECGWPFSKAMVGWSSKRLPNALAVKELDSFLSLSFAPCVIPWETPEENTPVLFASKSKSIC